MARRCKTIHADDGLASERVSDHAESLVKIVRAGARSLAASQEQYKRASLPQEREFVLLQGRTLEFSFGGYQLTPIRTLQVRREGAQIRRWNRTGGIAVCTRIRDDLNHAVGGRGKPR